MSHIANVDDVARIVTLREGGATQAEIAVAVRRDRAAVRACLQAAGIPGHRTPAQVIGRRVERAGGHLLWPGRVCTSPVHIWTIGGVRRTGSVRRVLYEAVHGPLPAGVRVYRSCDEGACVDPAHTAMRRPGRPASPRWMRDLNAGARQVAS